jgi:DNA primase
MPKKFIDFAELKERVSVTDVIPMLNLTGKQKGDQWRGACPRCDAGGDRALVITESKKAFYCHSARKGGDVIALVSHIEDLPPKEAAFFIAEHLGTGTSTEDGTVPRNSTSPEERPITKGAERVLQPLTYLDAVHEAVEALGVSEATCEHFGAGYAPKGILRGRLAIPIHDLTGNLVAYCGRAVRDDQKPLLKFPKDFQPELYVFNLHQIDGELYTTNDPLDVLIGYENGVENMVSFLHRPANVIELKKRA